MSYHYVALKNSDKLPRGASSHCAWRVVIVALILIAAAGMSPFCDLSAAPGSLIRTINNPFPASGDSFGWSVAGVGGNILIGANGDDTGASNSGEAYLIDGETGGVLLTINNPTPAASDAFGYHVAAVGNNLLVSAVSDDTGGNNTGSVYLFDGATGALLLTITYPAAAPFSSFGHSIAAVGNNILIGANREITGGALDAGSVYLFDGSLVGTTSVPLLTIPNPAPGEGDNFGHSVAGVGANILVGAYRDYGGGIESGAAYLFDGTTGGLLLKLHNPNPDADAGETGDQFGVAVAALGSDILVGAPKEAFGSTTPSGAVYLFDGTLLGTTSEPLLTIKSPSPATDDLGSAVAAVGGNILAGVDEDNGGAVYLFDGALRGTTSTPLFGIASPNPPVSNSFGSSVAAVEDQLLVGAYSDDTGAINAGAAYLFCGVVGACLALPSPTPTPVPTPTRTATPCATDAGPALDVTSVESPTVAVGQVFDLDFTWACNVTFCQTCTLTTFLASLYDPTVIEWLNPPAVDPFSSFSFKALKAGVTQVWVLAIGQTGNGQSGTGVVTVLGPTPTPTPSATTTPTPSPSPTAIPTPTPSPVPTLTPTPNPGSFVQGYFPGAVGNGEAVAFFDDQTPPNPLFRSYRIQVRRVDNPSVLVQSVVFNLPGGPGPIESHSTQFTLPILDDLFPTSWEIDVQYKTQAFAGENATGTTLFASSYNYAAHPSADVSDAPVFTNPPVLAGSENLQLTDSRATAKKGSYRYDIIREIQFGPTAQVGQLDHGIVGPFQTKAVHGLVQRSMGVPVVSGDQGFRVRTRREFRNSLGTSLGRYDISPQSPAAEVSAP